ncbi:hypothetical protein GGTG_07381 [Gaeumannomyces tritici R3-111a-1]|uniref:Uncharacterized protein n=1 Tax=Gaeumannomyces tritici (strain R3-111a-1) TaxID=644352 RepID=J3P1I4_GAET3|nr:hypothetical protein GGTG_07381 [Gaeumannomyces tritici R3-111a-1]EJT77469.1 hypothetical protein GGTG_07381 [Gaeumannomyces tritici R3-111a-1]
MASVLLHHVWYSWGVKSTAPPGLFREDEIMDFARAHYENRNQAARWDDRQIRNAFQIAVPLAYNDNQEYLNRYRRHRGRYSSGLTKSGSGDWNDHTGKGSDGQSSDRKKGGVASTAKTMGSYRRQN